MKEKIAIIGSGISGLTASYFLSSKYEVHLFEKNKRLGGHTRTINVKENTKYLSIDTGFIVFNENNYPDLTKFLKKLKVHYSSSDMSFSFSNENPLIEYCGKNLFSLFANFRNFFSFQFYKMIFEIKRLYNLCQNLDINTIDKDKTLNKFLNENNFSSYLKEYHILPMISSIWSSDISDVDKFPLITFVNFFQNHSLFKLKKRPKWKFITGGSNEYIKKIINKNLFNYKTNFIIKKIYRDKKSIKIHNKDGEIFEFDKIIFAVHADQVLDLLEKPSKEEMDIFSNFKYTINSAFLHSDPTLMPKSKKAWASWNFLKRTSSNKFTLTYWMNLLQNLSTNKNYFVTINPYKKPQNIINETVFEHPIYSTETLKAQKEVMKIQGLNSTYYCGAYLGYGFHEDGIQSSAHISKLLGCNLPWQRDYKFYNRLQIKFE